MGRGETAVLIVSGANPAYAAPPWAGFKAAMDKVPFKVALATSLDETAELCDLVLPASHPIESLGDAEPARGVWSLQQPAMQRLPMFDSRPAGDTLIAAARAAGTAGKLPEDWETYLKARWKTLQARFGAGKEFEVFWRESLQKGGVWEDVAAPPVRWAGAPSFAAPQIRGAGDLTLVLYASPALYDGRGANKPWLQELPDPTSKAVWNSWAEIHPETAARLGVTNGAKVKVETESGSVETYAYVYGGVRKDVVAMPLGQGHTAYGRAAKDRGVNPLVLLPAAQDAASGAMAYLSAKARVTKLAPALERSDLVLTQREKTQGDREVARLIPIAALLAGGATAGAERPAASADSDRDENAPAQRRPGRYTEPHAPLPGETTPPHAVTAFVPERVVRGPRRIPVNSGSYANPNHHHRWAMAIDLNSCTGCSACVVACYAENNVPTVGPELMKRGREMAWIRIERYEEKLGDPKGMGGETDVRFLPMMCQQCTDAPCEIVCPVYATYHNPEGLNAQVYNRCVGTRYCSNNCPYKVRAFNWYDYSAPEKVTFSFPEPLNWQLNPDVTVRSKGVMEKCTFCIQRILEGKGNARDENRALRDGEIQPACAQSCPTEAIVFGDLLDPESRVSKLSNGERRYWALDELNTKPGITYLKRIGRGSGAA
jgi:molybdopterin-containing oxidoreductase family iron-sulfur binding subunit